MGKEKGKGKDLQRDQREKQYFMGTVTVVECPDIPMQHAHKWVRDLRETATHAECQGTHGTNAQNFRMGREKE